MHWGGQLAKAVAKLIVKKGKLATLKLPYGEVRLMSKNYPATVTQVGNAGVNQKSWGIVWVGYVGIKICQITHAMPFYILGFHVPSSCLCSSWSIQTEWLY